MTRVPQIDQSRLAPAKRSSLDRPPTAWPGTALRFAARATTLGVLLAAPWFFGGVELRVQSYLYAAVVAALGLSALSMGVDRRQAVRPLLPAAMIPLAGALLLGTLHLLPLGGASPAVPVADASLKTGTISLYPASTRLDLAQLTIAAAAFAVGALLFAGPRPQRWLWGAVAINGAALAFLGITRKFGPHADLFTWLPGLSGTSFASYVNKNNAAGYLNLCFAAGVGLTLSALAPKVGALPYQAQSRLRPAGRRSTELLRTAREQLARLDARALFALALSVVIVAGVFCSMSRGGMVAVGCAGLMLLLAAVWKKGWAIGLGFGVALLLLSLGLIRWVNLDQAVGQRAHTLVDGRGAYDGRLSHWRDGSQAAKASWLLGTGLGTYRYAYLPQQQRLAEPWFYHAENQYLEALVEGGLVGLGLLIATIALVLLAARSLLHSGVDPHLQTVGLVGIVAVAGQGVHALFDFALYLPANMLTTAVLLGAVCGAAAAAPREQTRSQGVAIHVFKPGLVVLAVVLLVNGGLAVREVSAAGVAEEARFAIPRLDAPDSWSRPQVEQALGRLQSAIRARPDDAELRAATGNLLIYRFRLESFANLQESELRFYFSGRQQWDMTAPFSLHQRANQFQQAGQARPLETLRTDPLVTRSLVPALDNLRAAKAACPILPRVDIELAALAFLGEPTPAGEQHWRRAVALTPSDPEILTRAGMLALSAGLDDEACRLWRQSLNLTPRYQPAILQAAAGRMTTSQLVNDVLPPRPEQLLQLAQAGRDDDAPLRTQLLDRAEQLLDEEKTDPTPARWHHLRGTLDSLRQRPEAAIAHLSRAVEIEPTEVEWRFDLARALRAEGRIEDARREAALCSALAPRDRRIEKFQRELIQAELHGNRQPATTPSSSK